MDLKRIDEKKKVLDTKRPLPDVTVKSLREHILVEWTYNSNAIEGNTLTVYETRVVLEGITIGGKSLKEHLEVINHRDAILYLEDMIARSAPLSEWEIKNIHRLILKNIDDANAGVYRKIDVIISGARHRPPQPVLVQELMENMLARYHGDWQRLHPVERAALLHGELVKIHPFVDGNGRTARLLLNFELMKAGYPPVIIKKEQRAVYYEALDQAHISGDYGEFINLIADCAEASLDLWLSITNK